MYVLFHNVEESFEEVLEPDLDKDDFQKFTKTTEIFI